MTLVERLRSPFASHSDPGPFRLEAADRIEALEQERDRLREFVSEVAGLDCHRYTKPFDVQPGCDCLTCAARAALAATGGKP